MVSSTLQRMCAMCLAGPLNRSPPHSYRHICDTLTSSCTKHFILEKELAYGLKHLDLGVYSLPVQSPALGARVAPHLLSV